MKLIIAIVLVNLLVACGSGGGSTGGNTVNAEQEAVNSVIAVSSSSSSVSSTSSSSASSSIATAEVLITQTAQLQAAADFDFVSSEILVFSINDSQVHTKASALSICRVDEQGNADSNDCLLKARLQDRVFESNLNIGNEVEQLVLTLYIFDQPLRIETATWSRAMGMQWHLDY